MIRYLLKLLGLSEKASRSSQWPKVRAEHLKCEPVCQACGGSKQLEVHHIIPFSVDKSRELDQLNLITLCEANHCHFVFGHLFSWSSYNASCRIDAELWRTKVRERP